ncbi:EAL domain-containing protein [Sphingomonas jatrophae]|uniref:EAL domain, c-di-GMP-specific phosphodiesterase class I (Or its enzymatically inactive variant) n=1 Tax=Sphingomonas jatrophae TaxID=1166337 RepID=A0A1I6K7T5_9SPHN|nr:EAL domain-containing protein [Sphingomonas jatrophae]SFR87325.1 EAL domain, c-di-GMP-specific phosphodiesterase class I (or its enzymatically inactive variant) [Sphingomonas jatrophae]
MVAEFALALVLLIGATAFLVRRGSPRYPVVGAPHAAGHAAGSPFLPGDDGDTACTVFAVCEIDGFEKMRRHLGPAASNALIRSIAESIGLILPEASLGRQNRSAIEFAWTPEESQNVQARLADLLERLPRTYPLEGCALDVRPRLCFLTAGPGTASDEAFDRIEAALAHPAARHSDLIELETTPNAGARSDVALLRDLSIAIAEDALELHYQPKLDCRAETIASVEALLRWTHPTFGAIAADRMIAMAEESGLIRQLTRWVMTRALRDVAALDAAGVPLPIYVNISGALLPDERFAADVLEITRGAEQWIGLEITETAVIHDPERALANLNAFRAAGLNIAIDDYGSGLSSLAYLKQLPAQELKIDRLFISGLTTTHRDPLLVRSSIDLAHALEMQVTAEGVDSPMALSLLTVMGCDMVQGYLVSPPLPLAELIEFLRRDSHVAHIESAAPAILFARR